MPVPDFQSLMLPLLRFAGDGEEHTTREAIEHLAQEFRLSPEDRAQVLPSGRQTTFANRTYWAFVYLRKAGLLELVRRGVYRITQRGMEVLKEKPSKIDMKYLTRFPEYRDFRSARPTAEAEEDIGEPQQGAQTPDDRLRQSYEEMLEALKDELLEQVRQKPPQFLERLVLDLLEKMFKKRGRVTGRSGDGGIDGEIPIDPLGLDIIRFQAKRWEGTIGRPEVQRFAGALQDRRIQQRGVFVTTSSFSSEARDYADGGPIRLIDGEELASLMVEYGVGVSISEAIEIKKLDSDYFEAS